MPKCAFCDHEGRLTAEHIISQWIEGLFPGKGNVKFHSEDGKGLIEKTMTSDKIDYKARVVCESCNNGWMSDPQKKPHAKPVSNPANPRTR